MAHQVEVLILQHPLERDQPKGSARLLHLCLPLSRLLTGEAWTDAALLSEPFEPAAAAGLPRHNILLYPDTAQDTAPDLTPPPAVPPGGLAEPGRLRLVVLDGSWRKSRKMLYQSPPLQACRACRLRTCRSRVTAFARPTGQGSCPRLKPPVPR